MIPPLVLVIRMVAVVRECRYHGFVEAQLMLSRSSPESRRNWVGDEQGSITGNFNNPNLGDCFFAHQTSLFVAPQFSRRYSKECHTKLKIETIKAINYNSYAAVLVVSE